MKIKYDQASASFKALKLNKPNSPSSAKERLEKAYKLYKENYEKYYNAEERAFIDEHFFTDVTKKNGVDLLMQIYSELGLDEDQNTFYKAHLQKIKELFGLERNIIEVGSGFIPAVANKIAAYQQKIHKGTITIYEPLLRIMTSNYPNMTIHKEAFTLDTPVDHQSLGISILSCEATSTIIKSFCQNKMDFYIAMCGCDHSGNLFWTNPTFYQDRMIELAKRLVKEYDNGSLEVTTLDSSFNIDYPILYNRRK